MRAGKWLENVVLELQKIIEWPSGSEWGSSYVGRCCETRGDHRVTRLSNELGIARAFAIVVLVLVLVWVHGVHVLVLVLGR